MSETDDAVKLANRILDRPYADPDDDLATLSRQFLRTREIAIAERAQNATLREALQKWRDWAEPRGYGAIGRRIDASMPCSYPNCDCEPETRPCNSQYPAPAKLERKK